MGTKQLDQRLKSRSSLEELRAGNIMRSPAEEKSRSEEVNAAKNMLHDMYDQQPSSTKGGDVAYQVCEETPLSTSFVFR